MANRRDIREAFYNELELAISGLSAITAGDISQEFPESAEEFPRIVHNDNYRQSPMNRASAGPHDVETDTNGNEAAFIFYSMMGAQFGVVVIHDDEQSKEDIYEAVRRHFERYEHQWWNESDIQSDVHEVDVRDATSEDDENREPIARGDRILVRLGYTRDYRVVREDLAGTTGWEDFDATYADNIEDVEHAIDMGPNGTTDETYTTTQ